MAPLNTINFLSLFDILKLVGFAMGAALHFYLFWMLYSRFGLKRSERSLLGLGLSISFWHLGNFAAAIYQVIDVSGGIWWLKISGLVAYVALAFLPPTLAHSHFKVLAWFEHRYPRGLFRLLIILGYVPLVILPWAAAEMLRDPYQPPIEKLSVLFVPFILWIVFIFLECAMIDLWLSGKVVAALEKRFFKVFAATLMGIGALFALTYLVGARDWGVFGKYLELFCLLSSIAPTTIVAYYIYRYRYLELVIRQSFVYAALATMIMIVYIFGIRRLSLLLAQSYGLRAEAMEALMIMVLIFLSGPLRRVTEYYMHRLFAREVGLYRELVAQVGEAASSYGELARFVSFAENRLKAALELEDLSILAGDSIKGGGAVAEICRIAEDRRLSEVEDGAMLSELNALACYLLWREGRVVGMMIVRGSTLSLDAEKREVLAVLAGHIAVAIERCRLLEENVKLERELSERERMAALGQMAATVAHEVKNPLSAIKSITQVMREDQSLSAGYGRDLDLITGEVDRLNRTVSQLLSFSRPSALPSAPSSLKETVDNVVALNRALADEHVVRFNVDLKADPVLDGAQTAAVREILMNLVTNAAQAVADHGQISIESKIEGGKTLHLSVADDGVGIPQSLQERVFEPFFTTRQRGTGLGLQIVLRRARDLGGAIDLISPVAGGRGTRFELKFEITKQTK